MKRNTLITTAAIVAAVVTGGAYLGYLYQTRLTDVIMIDVTPSIPTPIDTTELLNHIIATSSEWSETTIHFSTFSDFLKNKTTTVTIPIQFPLLTKPKKHVEMLNASNHTIAATITALNTRKTGRPHSVIYKPMAESLNWLASCSTRREALFYTDCFENTDSFSMYSIADRQRLTSQREQVKAYFEKQVPLQSLNGITIHIMYNAPNPALEGRFLLMANLWAEIFREHGATVIVGTNLTTN